MSYAQIDRLSDQLDVARAAYEVAEESETATFEECDALYSEMHSLECDLKELCSQRDEWERKDTCR
jgi:uncharacterized protein (DUF3084 family)